MSMIHAPVLAPGQRGSVWIQSDLQLSDPALASQVLTNAVDDILQQKDLNIGAIWCLGDAVCGSNLANIEEVARTTIQQLGRLNVPICYVQGNHESDLKRTHNLDRYPLYELAKTNPLWHISDRLDDPYFARMIYGTLVVFMGDHMASDSSWWTSHGKVKAFAEKYPYPPEMYQQLRDAIARHDGPVATASHYSYPGGQRHSELMRPMLPLPANLKFHCYGHAHIGDLVWNSEKPYLRPNPIESQSLIQFNISALETARSAGSHSAILDIGPDGPEKLRIRCHLEKRWTEEFSLPMHQ